jgi:hypothetical protein
MYSNDLDSAPGTILNERANDDATPDTYASVPVVPSDRETEIREPPTFSYLLSAPVLSNSDGKGNGRGNDLEETYEVDSTLGVNLMEE